LWDGLRRGRRLAAFRLALRHDNARAIGPHAANRFHVGRLRGCGFRDRLFRWLRLDWPGYGRGSLRLGDFTGFGRAEAFSLLIHLALGFFLDAALLILDLSKSRILALTGFLDLALALLDILALSRLDQSAGSCVHLSGGQLAQHLLRPLIAGLIRRWLLEDARLRLCRSRLSFLLLLRLFR
jgi:hypothetical protein